ncbi:hypothetical protein COHA_008775 [Chlorella ohadii]|uniref:DUF1232 domain-containing protein n=1 Tax=Chlorella ohadii TaxID=2649997 RepID=A0AAD5H1A1_9CHLO|nr:hypothetical protein COHA_008775 [Chlorella ohadii]
MLDSPQDDRHHDGASWSRAGPGLPRTPSYPSTDPSSITATASTGGGWLAGLKSALHKLKREVKALNYAVQDPRVGFLPRLLALLTIAYLLSPLDLLPDIIPVIGLLDDLIIVPALLMLAVLLIPNDVMADARERAEREPLRLRNNWGMACVFFAMWDALLLALGWWAIKRFGGPGLRHWRWWIEGGAAVVLIAGEAAWSWRRYRQEVLQEAERAAARLARARARARHAAYCAAAAERVWPDVPAAALPPPLPAPAVCMPAVAQEPTAAAAAAGRSKGVDSDLKVALLAEEWEP